MSPEHREVADARVVQAGVERERLLREVEHAAHVEVQLDHRLVRRRQRRVDRPQHREHRARILDHESELGVDQRRRPPADLGHRPEDVVTADGREDRLEVGEDRGRVVDDVGGEEDVVEVALADSVQEASAVDRTVDAGEPADAVEREAEAELNWRELRRDDDQERETLVAVGELRLDDPEGLDRHAVDGKLERAEVAAVGGVEGDEAAAGDGTSVDGNADARRGVERHVCVGRS